MRHIIRRAVVLLMIAIFVAVPLGTSAFAWTAEDNSSQNETAEVSGGKIFFDAVLIRPFGLVATIIGSVAYVVSYPFAWTTGDTRKTYEKLIKDPVDYTFKRHIGDF